jgi:hypothetical protein
VVVAWVGSGVYALWFTTRAKDYAPISLFEASVLWRIHKRDFNCSGKRWQEIKRGKKVVGFECECGFRHVQKRPLVQSPPVVPINARAAMLKKAVKHV